jgi:hypothetical protein
MARVSRLRLGVAIATIMALVLVPTVIKAIYVTPHAVFIDHSARSAQVTLGNSSDVPEEVTVELRFGFPDTDSAGTPFIRFVDDPGSRFPSAADWIRPFPRRVRLEPGTQQVVRLLAQPPDSLPDGEYWSRLIVTARRPSAPIATGDTAVRAGVALEIRLITSVTYRKGNVRTGIDLRDMNVSVEGDSLVSWVRATREGNGAYLGTAAFEMLDQERSVVREWSVPIAVYYPMNRRFSFPLESLGSGMYMVRLTLEARRPDLLEDEVLTAPTVVDSIEVSVP